MKNVDNKPLNREEVAQNRYTTQQNKNSSGVSRKHFRFDRGWCFVIFLLLLVAVIYCVVCVSKSFDFFLGSLFGLFVHYFVYLIGTVWDFYSARKSNYDCSCCDSVSCSGKVCSNKRNKEAGD